MNFEEKSVNEKKKSFKEENNLYRLTELCVVELGLKPESLSFMTSFLMLN